MALIVYTTKHNKSGAFPLNPGEVTDRHLAPSRGLCRPQNSEISSDIQCGATSPASIGASSFSFSSTSLLRNNTSYTKFSIQKALIFLVPTTKPGWEFNHPKTSSSAADSLITHASASSHASGDVGLDVLSEVLKLPEPAAQSKRKRRPALNSKATALTDDAVLAAIKEKEAEKIQKEADKEARKKEREQRKKEREEAKEQRKREREAKQHREKTHKRDAKVTESKKQDQSTSSTGDDLSSALNQCSLIESDHESDAECRICGLTFLEDDSGSAWVCCDGCQTWVYFKCTGLKNPKQLPKWFFCSSCKV